MEPGEDMTDQRPERPRNVYGPYAGDFASASSGMPYPRQSQMQ